LLCHMALVLLAFLQLLFMYYSSTEGMYIIRVEFLCVSCTQSWF
jgi:hypothetical protein